LKGESEKSLKIGDVVADVFVVLVLAGLAAGLVSLLWNSAAVASSLAILFSLAYSVSYLSGKLEKMEKRLSEIEETIKKQASQS